MLDIKRIRKESELVEAKLKTKDPSINLAALLALDDRIRVIKTNSEELKSACNALSKTIGERKRKKEDPSELMQEMIQLGEQVHVLDRELEDLQGQWEEKMAALPNIPQEGIKESLDPQENVCIKVVGEKRTFAFPFKNHVELNEQLHLFDFKRAAKTTGSNWPCYRGMGARMEWALLNYMIDVHLENGFEFWLPPHLVRPQIMQGAGQLPKFAHQLFSLHDAHFPLYLIPTAEVVLNGLHYDEIFPKEELPKKYVSYTPCFRREAGAAGASERGLIRMHQFNKVEMYAFAAPDQSEGVFQEMLQGAEQILQGLGLHYRVMELVTGDTSFAAAKTYDIEVWLPGQNRYYEVSSISHCTDFQARRSHIRYKLDDEKPEPVHTLNGSGLATSRLMVALLENGQHEEGHVTVPPALHRYLGGIKELRGNPS